MQTKSALAKFKNFRITQVDKNKWRISSRTNDKRCVDLVDQSGVAILFAMSWNGEQFKPAYCNHTLKAMYEFLTEHY